MALATAIRPQPWFDPRYAIPLAGIILGWRYVVGLVRQEKLWGGQTPPITVPQIDDLVLWVTLGVIAGGRIGYILFYMLVQPEQRAALFDNPMTAVISFPHVLGHEVVGTVVEAGKDVRQVKKGDRVACYPWITCAVRGLPPPALSPPLSPLACRPRR